VAAAAVQLDLPIPDPTTTVPGPIAIATPASAAIRKLLERWGATPVFDVYWRFAVQRQRVLCRRLAGDPPPWTDDPIIARYRFTNPYRFTDRVSQHLLRRVQYGRPWDARTLVLRTLLFKIFNRIDTWEAVVAAVGEPTVATFSPTSYEKVLRTLKETGARIYSPAYIVPNPPYGAASKHENHLRMLSAMLDNGTVDRLASASDLSELFKILLTVPSLGPFLAFQYAVDINYSTVTDADEDGFVVPGPGARDGLRKCFHDLPAGAESEALLCVTETQHEHFARLGLDFPYLHGRSLRPIDCQNLFCEVGKYARVSHPGYAGNSGRRRIKQVFDGRARPSLLPLFFPPKWLTREHVGV
jgi:hypothetical protein